MRRQKTGFFLGLIVGLFAHSTGFDKRNQEVQSLISDDSVANESDPQPLSTSLQDNLARCKRVFVDCSDVMFRSFTIGDQQPFSACLIWTDGLVDQTVLNEDVLKSLMHETRLLEPSKPIDPKRLLSFIREGLLSVGDVKEKQTLNEVIDAVLTGNSVLLLDGISTTLVISARGWESRSVTEPVTEGVVRGPRQGFTENIRVNTALVRRIVKTPKLKMKTLKIGTMTKTDITVVYVQGLAEDKIVEEILRRLNRIQVDSVLESAYIEEMIEDHPYSPFPQVAYTERPDKIAAHLLEGKVAILVDGTPFALSVPVVFVQFLQSNEDYYERYYAAFMIRIVRYLFFTISLILPSAYIAVTTYHQEMLPTPLLISIAGSHEGVPFPAFVEAFLMEITFEALREAGVRLPKPVGQAVSIVGALVIGQAAVQAGIVSPAMVIVVAVTGIASFTMPAFNVALTIRMLRFPMMLIAATFGFYGIDLGLLAILIHLNSLRSFGVPYLSPLAPFNKSGMKDTIVRAPWWMMRKRPEHFAEQNVQRQDAVRPQRIPESNN